jgi:hypothetical protein
MAAGRRLIASVRVHPKLAGIPLHRFVASLELGIAGPEKTKTRRHGPGFEYKVPLGGLSKKRWRRGRGLSPFNVSRYMLIP